jgi:cold shock CspA family protein
MSTKQGTVISFDRFKGYGFALPDDGGNDIFIHRNNLPADHRYLEQADRIDYEVGDRNGRPIAVNVRLLGAVVRP